MRWKALHTKTNYTHSQTRVVRRFAWLPVYINGTAVWLEAYEILQFYNVTTYSVEPEVGTGEEIAIMKGEWLDITKRTIDE